MCWRTNCWAVWAPKLFAYETKQNNEDYELSNDVREILLFFMLITKSSKSFPLQLHEKTATLKKKIYTDVMGDNDKIEF